MKRLFYYIYIYIIGREFPREPGILKLQKSY